MAKSEQSKLNYAARLELRLRRDKAATALLAAFVSSEEQRPADRLLRCKLCIDDAVRLADLLIAELDRTRPELAKPLSDE